MAENTGQTNHPWNTLTTLTTFDQGNNMDSTFCSNDNTENLTSGQITRVNPSSGVVIESLVNQICSILEKDKTRRKKLYNEICAQLYKMKIIDNSYNMMEFEGLRKKYQHALYQLIKIAYSASGNENPLYNPSFLSELSRYHREFNEISFIAGGGFGEVYKARHRLDGIDYAVKKIAVTSSHANTLQQHLNEVKTLAKLNHANIVSYKAAWIEVAGIEVPSFNCSPLKDHKSHKLHTSYCTEESTSYNLLDNDMKVKQQNKKRGSTDDFEIRQNLSERLEELNSSTENIEEWVVEDNAANYIDEISSDIVSFRNSKKSKISNETKDSNNYIDHNYLCDESTSQEIYTYTSNENHQYMILYIQMALCEQTLEQWMRGRLNASPEPVIREILKQILCGIDYIHSQSVVHHDIKPRNIFISTSGQLQIQLGDFGLACPLKSQGKNHSACGTHMYAAPEQLQGKCDPKNDIYSVGVVLIELLIPTQTQMELSSVTRCLKNGYIPKSLPTERHKWAQMIIQMVQKDPVKRPWTKQLLQSLKKDEDITIAELRNTVGILEDDIRDKNNTIQELEKKIALLKNEVKMLKDPLENTIE
ncbi:eukaryotic translation initiation factor 2-alpha kinase 1 isoform X1 [Camponotus floridanus]|uniref:eukaryotic translation initiation factor 2-alpha kinase 1 isoform X1 n=1 Tax=Camponotus floridanus TaxID=104421 RepID=UPI00059D83EC|nr:eukaryotic translation initiation factor 2-alpha kinase 1 isoform X1 [Camponotus floridanus]